MIIAHLNGGLGNQMFQYAAAKRLAVKHNTDLYLDISEFETYKAQVYALENFNIDAEVLNPKHNKYFQRVRSEKTVDKIKSKIYGVINGLDVVFIKEEAYSFDSKTLALPNNTYLQGYWQSEKYFGDIREIIKKDFIPKSTLSIKTKDMEQLIKNKTNSVSLHVRRGDYISNKEANAVHGVNLNSYYKACIYHMAETIGDLNIFIFSDDSDWVKKNLEFNHNIIYVDHNNSETAYQDIYLMSKCEHNIIANSSFSWWGAWLNSNEAKMVFAPSKWFLADKLDTRDLIPDEWIKA